MNISGERLRKTKMRRPRLFSSGLSWPLLTRITDSIRQARVARVLLERPVYREFFAAGLRALDPIEGFTSAAAPAHLEVQSLFREIGLIDKAGLEDGSISRYRTGRSERGGNR